MFGMGMPEILLILAIALIVLGPKKLPEIAKALGRGISEFKKATQDFKESIDVDDDLKGARDAIHEIKGDIETSVKKSVAESRSPGKEEDLSRKDTAEGKDVKDSLEGDIKGEPQAPSQDQPRQEAEHKEPSRDA